MAIELDPSRLSTQAAALLTMRGLGVGPLKWSAANPIAEQLLDKLDDTELFTPHKLAEESSGCGAAVRALLYLWHGHGAQSAMYALAAADKARLYITALSHRHQSEAQQAKESFAQLQGHPIFEPLASYAQSLIGPGADKSVKRVGDIIAMDQQWEPHAFSDLWTQAVEGQLSNAGELVVRQIQHQEFMLLLHHCYLAATGQNISKQATRPTADDASRARRERTLLRRKSQTRSTLSNTTPPRQVTKPTASAKSASMHVRCPKCKHTDNVARNHAGQPHTCTKCAVSYRIPGGKSGSASGGASGGMQQIPDDTIRIGCPHCKAVLRFATNARGSSVQCSKCAATFKLSAASAA